MLEVFKQMKPIKKQAIALINNSTDKKRGCRYSEPLFPLFHNLSSGSHDHKFLWWNTHNWDRT